MKLLALLRSSCPRCLQGRVFVPGITGLVGAMNESCPVCGLRFLRESGYFLGAIYISYGLGILTILPVAVIMAVLLDWPVAAMLSISLLQTVLSVPLFLRYSRLIWLYMDQSIDPR